MHKNTYHKSVLVNEVLEYLNPQNNKLYVDVTFGGGGHTRAILERAPGCRVLALDWDNEAIERNAPPLTEEFGDRFQVEWSNFGLLYKVLRKHQIKQIDGILADFGTSQFQIHEKAGFSFSKKSPLDMRMSSAHQSLTAAAILNNWTEREIADVLFTYGEESAGKLIARAVVQSRKVTPFRTTDQLTGLIESLFPAKHAVWKKSIHPATKTFQALRIAVNSELDHINSFFAAALNFLAPKGRLVCISFHSLEDRLVKNFFKTTTGKLEILTSKPVTATEAELAANPSSRSAKLRAAEKI